MNYNKSLFNSVTKLSLLCLTINIKHVVFAQIINYIITIAYRYLLQMIIIQILSNIDYMTD